jgi:glycopeptide antibiotics resistance protein
VLIAYGSLIPLTFEARSLGEIRTSIELATDSAFVGISRTDFVGNLLLFVPLGFLAAGVLKVNQTRRWRRTAGVWLALAILASLFGASLELVQLFVKDRTLAVSDVLAQTLGANGGIALWAVLGAATNRWLRSLPIAPSGHRACRLSTSRRRIRSVSRIGHVWIWAAAIIWITILACQQWAPFDFQRDPQYLRERLHRLTVVPFEHYYYRPLPLAIAEMTRKLIFGMPLGALLALNRRARRVSEQRLQAFGALVPAVVTIALIEVGQLFVPSRTPDPTDVLLQSCGTFFGWLILSNFSVFRRRERRLLNA